MEAPSFHSKGHNPKTERGSKMCEDKKDETVKEEVKIHTLLTREVRPIRNWHEWLGYWQKAENLEWMESLLHVGFSISLEKNAHSEKEYDEIDRLIFFFTIADGWTNDDLLAVPYDGGKTYCIGSRNFLGQRKKVTVRELRQQLACKAFDMLCLNFFKTELMSDEGNGFFFTSVWGQTITSERLFPVIQNFFGVEKPQFRFGRIRIRNLSCRTDKRSHNEQEAVNFLSNLTKFIWGWKGKEREVWSGWEEERKEDEKKRRAEFESRLNSAKPWMIEVLSQLHRLDLLNYWILELDKSCLAALRKIALQSSLEKVFHTVSEDRLVSTLDEACYAGSEAAWLIKRHELVVREHKRLLAIIEEKQRKEEASQKIKKLTKKK